MVNNKKTFGEWFGSRKIQRRLVIFTFMFVPLLLLLMFTYIPFGKMVQFSFYNMKYIGKRNFVGLKNYVEVFNRPEIFKSLFVSVYYMGGAVLQLALALFFATLMVFKVKGESVFKPTSSLSDFRYRDRLYLQIFLRERLCA